MIKNTIKIFVSGALSTHAMGLTKIGYKFF